MQKIILVNDLDKKIGEIGKLEAHLDKGQRHRAFTAIIINNQKKILLAQRALQKPLWPTFWDGSFSSHPYVGENLNQAGIRRAKEELGIITKNYKILFSYTYEAKWSEFFSENEFTYILLTKYNGKVNPNSNEILSYKWVSWTEMETWIKKEPNVFVPWWLIAVKMIKKDQKLLNILK